MLDVTNKHDSQKDIKPNIGSYVHASTLFKQMELFEDLPGDTLKLPSYREPKSGRLDPDWLLLLELLRNLDLSFEHSRLIHNALNPDRAYSATRFRIKFRKAMAKRRVS